MAKRALSVIFAHMEGALLVWEGLGKTLRLCLQLPCVLRVMLSDTRGGLRLKRQKGHFQNACAVRLL